MDVPKIKNLPSGGILEGLVNVKPSDFVGEYTINYTDVQRVPEEGEFCHMFGKGFFAWHKGKWIRKSLYLKMKREGTLDG